MISFVCTNLPPRSIPTLTQILSDVLERWSKHYQLLSTFALHTRVSSSMIAGAEYLSIVLFAIGVVCVAPLSKLESVLQCAHELDSRQDAF